MRVATEASLRDGIGRHPKTTLEHILFEEGKIEIVDALLAVDYGVELPPYGNDVVNNVEQPFGHLDPLAIDDQRGDHSALDILVSKFERSRKISVASYQVA